MNFGLVNTAGEQENMSGNLLNKFCDIPWLKRV